jgi:5-methylthioadenosine/S-adenosylhomocysteine deaminase
LSLATREGARLLGLADQLGSLEPGKRADLVVVNPWKAHAAPAPDPVSTLVYATQARDVEHVFVEGEDVVRHGELTKLDHDRVVFIAREQAPKLARRAGLR